MLGRAVTSDDPGDGRVLTTTWHKGISKTGQCYLYSANYSYCGNNGFPDYMSTSLSGSRSFAGVAEPSDSRSFTRYFYYQYATPSAFFDSSSVGGNVNFYSMDRDLAVTGKPLKERGTDGRYAARDDVRV